MLKKSIMKSGSAIVIISVLAAAISFGKEMVFANHFGISGVADAYSVAIQIPEVLFAILWQTLNAIVIPFYSEKLYKSNAKAASNYISNLLTILGLGSIAIIIIVEVFADGILILLSPGLEKEVHILAVSLFRWTFPILIFDLVIRVSICILNVNRKFVLPKSLNTVRNIILITFLLMFTKKFGINAAAYGTLTGIALECILFIISVRPYYKYRFILDVNDPCIVQAGKLAIPTIIGTGVTEINQIVDKIIASFLGIGSIASLSYASKLSNIIYVVIINNIIVLCYPKMAEYAAKEQTNGFYAFFLKVIKLTILLCVPIIFVGTALREDLASIVFFEASFNISAIRNIGNIFACYLLCALFTAIRIVATRVFTIYKDAKTIMNNSLIGALLNIVLNILMSQLWGALGLAIATLISTAIVTMRLLFLIKKRQTAFSFRSAIVLFTKASAASSVSFLIIVILKRAFDLVASPDSTIQLLLFVVIAAVSSIIVYGLMLLLLRTNEIKTLITNFIAMRRHNRE